MKVFATGSAEKSAALLLCCLCHQRVAEESDLVTAIVWPTTGELGPEG